MYISVVIRQTELMTYVNNLYKRKEGMKEIQDVTNLYSFYIKDPSLSEFCFIQGNPVTL